MDLDFIWYLLQDWEPTNNRILLFLILRLRKSLKW